MARDAEMAKLEEFMLPNSAYQTSRNICVLYGLGGVVKT